MNSPCSSAASRSGVRCAAAREAARCDVVLTFWGIAEAAITSVTAIGESPFPAKAAPTAAAAATGTASAPPVAAIAVSSVTSFSAAVTAVAAPAPFTAATSNKLGHLAALTVKNRHPMPFVHGVRNTHKEDHSFGGGNFVFPLAEIGTNSAAAADTAIAAVVAARETAGSAWAPKFYSQARHSGWDYPLIPARLGPRL